MQRALATPILFVSAMYFILAVGDVLHVAPTATLNQLVRLSLIVLAVFHIWADWATRKRAEALHELIRVADYYRAHPEHRLDHAALLVLFTRLGYRDPEGDPGKGRHHVHERPAGGGEHAVVQEVRTVGGGLPDSHAETDRDGATPGTADKGPDGLPGTAEQQAGD
ncbi:MAG TPA: hypothetical protein PK530_00195 [Anaerolineales bacterium]|nr:hypothetical protein [Anaerolineales bacterium]